MIVLEVKCKVYENGGVVADAETIGHCPDFQSARLGRDYDATLSWKCGAAPEMIWMSGSDKLSNYFVGLARLHRSAT